MDNDDFLFIPLGGVGKIGMNVSLYHYQGKWIMIDLGVGFADSDMPGVDLTVADISFIAKKKDDLLGIILTHAHEDHLGAIQYLWKDLRCPIFATNFTATFLRSKLKEFKLEDAVPINIIEQNESFTLGPFDIEFINVTHSIPEANAIAIGTDAGKILHTGDWKFDPGPVIGSISNTERLKELGNQGLLAVICDSTNAFTKTESQSESGVEDHIYNIIRECKQLVAVSLFASNVARIETICKVAEKLGRKVALLGKSLWRIVEVSQESGYLADYEFLGAEEASRFSRDKMLLLCTGCQGEPLAASSKLAQRTHPTFQMQKGDTIIFSSRMIPGNEQRIHNMFNSFVNMGVEVITEDTRHVHVSGHPVREELKIMYELTKPKISIPVHGEYIHMYEHGKLAQECGVDKSIMARLGDVIDLVDAKKIDSVQFGYFGIDGKFLRHPDGDVMKMRRKMQNSGLVIVTVILNKKNKLLKDPVVFAPGVLDHQKDQGILRKISKEVETAVFLKDLKKIRHKVRDSICNLLKRQLLKKPLIEIQIEQI
ncbi:MAG: MBL fold hydrolase [Candidatus Mesenet longicola]|uniref:MBL fold hydrolase n=1 Tax=Candidatus Mesenet longicola TaxID=1892558 RepID=A0A8J3HU20_9RICK|nr:MAG: MBL fold hydrolase [Candidatus Mesenet longicola]GHM59055.1 MAG: MBL fold hydrolase [Candidatus Mesenet longicola]